MRSAIDRQGCFRGKIVESGVGASKNGFPQFTVQLVALQRYVEDANEMKSFELTEPTWVDWSSYDQDIVDSLTLFGNDKDNPGAMKPTFQIEALKKALGWDGSSFASLAALDVSEKLVTFWVEENEYQGVVRLRLSTLDDGEASPNRGLRILDAKGLMDLDSKFANMLGGTKTTAKPASTPAKPPASPAKPGVAAPPKSSTVAKPAATPSPAKTTTAPAPVSPKVAPASPSKAPPAKTPPVKPAAVKEEAPFATTMTKDQAWDSLMTGNKTKDDDKAAEAWLSAADSVVSDGREEEQITGEEWAKIAATALAAVNA